MVFIAGHMRSGTSMVRTLLGSHSELALHENDLQLWTRLYGRFELRWGREPAGAIAVELARAVFGDQKFEYLAHQVDAESFEQKLLKDDLDSLPSYAALAAHVFGRYLDAYRELRGRVRTGCKTPENEFFARHILDNFPQGKMIQVYRNVAGVAGSFKKKGTLERVFPLGLVEMGFLWSKSLECGYENMLHYPG